MELFNKHLLDQKISSFKCFPDDKKADICRSVIDSWAESIKTGQLEKIKETSAEQSFLAKFFVEILGYQPLGSNDEFYNIYPKYTIGTMFADATLGFFSNSRQSPKAVVELKGANIPLDKKQGEREKGYTPVAQAFEYASNIDGCNWVIVSNFKEIRLYNKQRSQSFYSSFNVVELTNPETFKRFYYLFCKENLICDGQKSPIDNLLSISTENDENITKQFYSEYKQVRLAFFKHLQEHNPSLDKALLLEKTQKFLDRFIFVLFCEDTNGLLPFDITKSTYETGKKSRDRYDERIWREFRNLFQDIDEGRSPINKYNGGLFKCDEILDSLSIKDEIWEELMKLARWDFETDLNVNILGHIFEQSISDLETIRAEISGEQVDKSKSKRKKEGVYYTPEYITKYIVENTVGRWIEENPDKMLNVKILDPACGSGAFLNQAHSFLTRQYKLHNEEAMLAGKGKAALFDYHSEAEILTNNLFGVDLNEESVEITKLTLWLKTATKDEQLKNLDGNIKCGNSVIDDPAFVGDKAFIWNQQFKEIMDTGGFDVIIGNPPYVRQEFLSPVKPALQAIYGSFYNGVADLYTYFYKRAFQLLKPGGYLGLITSSTFTKTGSGANLREFLKTETTIDRFVDFGDLQLFGDATNYPCIIIARKAKPEDGHKVIFSGIDTMPNLEASGLLDNSKQIESLQSNLGTDAWNFDRPEVEALRTKIFLKGKPLKEIVGSPLYGIKTGLNEAFIIDKATKDRLIKEDSKSAELIKPFLVGRDLKQWHYDYQDRYLIFTRHGTDIDQYPAIKKHLEQFRERLEPKPLNLSESESRNWKGRKPGSYKWFEIQDNIAYYKSFEEPKIVWCDISIKPNFSFDTKCTYLGNTGYILSGSFWLNALLMSKCWWYMFTSQSTTVQNGYYRMIFQNVVKPPIVEPQGSEDDPATDKGRLALLSRTAQEKAFKRLEYRKGFLGYVADLINQKSKEAVDDDEVSEGSLINKWDTLSWNDFAKAAATPSAFGRQFVEACRQIQTNMDLKKSFGEMKSVCQQLTCEIHECERQINEIVYRLYDLTPDEIKLLEELTGNIYED